MHRRVNFLYRKKLSAKKKDSVLTNENFLKGLFPVKLVYRFETILDCLLDSKKCMELSRFRYPIKLLEATYGIDNSENHNRL